MNKVAILGHFAFGMDKANGQTIKTKIIGAELKKVLGDEEVVYFDTMGGWKFLFKMPFTLIRLLRNYRNIVFLPAYKAVYLIVPLLVLFNFFYHRNLHYVVVGGRLPQLLRKHPVLRLSLRYVNHIYLETKMMSKELEKVKLKDVVVMPNCKSLDIVKENQLAHFTAPPYPLCTFSRVERSKGIEDAINAVNACNKNLGKTFFNLHIYGLIQDKEWFDNLMRNQSENVTYQGVIDYSKSTEILRQYFALLFPTYYAGEGFAGTIIDAMAAGLPVIASDWKANPEIIKEGETGMLFPVHATEALTDILLLLAERPQLIDTLRRNCIQEAKKYQPEVVIQSLVRHLA